MIGVSQLCLIPRESQAWGWLGQNSEPGTDKGRAGEEAWTWVEGDEIKPWSKSLTQGPLWLWREH